MPELNQRRKDFALKIIQELQDNGLETIYVKINGVKPFKILISEAAEIVKNHDPYSWVDEMNYGWCVHLKREMR